MISGLIAKGLDLLGDIFAEIYSRNMWGDGDVFWSGEGSHAPSLVDPYVKCVLDWVAAQPHPLNIVDLGCGDFSVGNQLLATAASYVGCDVVPQLIEWNRKRYPHVEFVLCDITKDLLPVGDVAIIRQVLQHLSNRDISRIIPKLQQYSHIIVTEHLPKSPTFTPNLDKPSNFGIRIGMNSGVRITKPPFCMPVTHEQVLCTVEDKYGVIETTVYTI